MTVAVGQRTHNVETQYFGRVSRFWSSLRIRNETASVHTARDRLSILPVAMVTRRIGSEKQKSHFRCAGEAQCARPCLGCPEFDDALNDGEDATDPEEKALDHDPFEAAGADGNGGAPVVNGLEHSSVNQHSHAAPAPDIEY